MPLGNWKSTVNKAIFIHIPKTGGQSICRALGAQSVLVRGTIRRRKLVQGNRFFTIGHHWPARKIKKCLDSLDVPMQWDSCFRFSFVRNPWDRVVSLYFFKKMREGEKYPFKNDQDKKRIANMTFEEWIIRVLQNRHIKNQYDYITVNNKVVTDFIGRFEAIQSDFKNLCDKLEYRAILPHVCKSKHDHYSKYYSKHTKELVADFFRKDINYFGYSF